MNEEEKKKLNEKLEALTDEKRAALLETLETEDKEVKLSPEVQKALDEIKVQLAELKPEDKTQEVPSLKVFSNDAGMRVVSFPTNLDELKDEEKIVQFYRAIVHSNKAEAQATLKALSEGVDADGGFLVPAPLADQIFEILPDISVFRSLATVLPMTSRTLESPSW